MKNSFSMLALAFSLTLAFSACGSGQRTEDDDPDTVMTDTSMSDTLDTLNADPADPTVQGLQDDSTRTDSTP